MNLFGRLAVLGIVGAVCTSCDYSTDPVGEADTFVGTWAGRQWSGEAGAVLVGDSLYVFGSTPESGWAAQESVRAVVKVTGPGTYTLGPDAVRFDELVGGDVISATYVTTGNATGTLTLTKYDGPGKRVEGTLSFDAESSSQHRSYGARARMDNASFVTSVQQHPRN